jgi:hypothetical protein
MRTLVAEGVSSPLRALPLSPERSGYAIGPSCLALVGGHSPGLRTGGEGGATASGASHRSPGGGRRRRHAPIVSVKKIPALDPMCGGCCGDGLLMPGPRKASWLLAHGQTMGPQPWIRGPLQDGDLRIPRCCSQSAILALLLRRSSSPRGGLAACCRGRPVGPSHHAGVGHHPPPPARRGRNSPPCPPPHLGRRGVSRVCARGGELLIIADCD